MAKQKVKVDLNKYISPKEKAKNTFVIACFLLVILTFAIFITYAFFLNEKEENLVSTKTIDPFITMSSEIVDNTNNQQKNIYLSNTTNYNLVYNLISDNDLFYKIVDDSYSHISGVIAANETIKIRLVSNIAGYFDNKSDDDLGIYVKANYLFTDKFSISKINYSTLNDTTILNSLIPTVGKLNQEYNLEIKEYSIKVENDINFVNFNYETTLNGRLFYDQTKLKVGNNEREMILRASDGTYIDTYKINIYKKDIPKGSIDEIYLYNNGELLDTTKIEDNEIVIKIPKSDILENNYSLSFHYLDSDDYCEDNDTCKYCYSYDVDNVVCQKDNEIDINQILNDTLEITIIDKEQNENIYNKYKITFEKEA